MKLGEIPGGEQESRPVRFIQPDDENTTAELLEQLRDAWSASGGNELIIKDRRPSQSPPPPANAEKKEAGETEEADGTGERTAPPRPAIATARHGPLRRSSMPAPMPAKRPKDAELPNTASEPDRDARQRNGQPAPVTITVTEDGRLMLSSSDTAALDRMEELIEQLSPPEKRFKVYPLKHIPAVAHVVRPDGLLQGGLEGRGRAAYVRDWFGFRVPTGSQDKARPACRSAAS